MYDHDNVYRFDILCYVRFYMYHRKCCFGHPDVTCVCLLFQDM